MYHLKTVCSFLDMQQVVKSQNLSYLSVQLLPQLLDLSPRLESNTDGAVRTD